MHNMKNESLNFHFKCRRALIDDLILHLYYHLYVINGNEVCLN